MPQSSLRILAVLPVAQQNTCSAGVQSPNTGCTAVDQPRRQCAAMRVDHHPRIAGVAIRCVPDGDDAAGLADGGVGSEDQLFQPAREHQPDIADDHAAGPRFKSRGERSGSTPAVFG